MPVYSSVPRLKLLQATLDRLIKEGARLREKLSALFETETETRPPSRRSFSQPPDPSHKHRSDRKRSKQ